jgi:la-related protein 1
MALVLLRGKPQVAAAHSGRMSADAEGSFEHYFQERPRTLSPFSPASVPSVTPVRLYWVKGKDAPVEFLPLDSTYESYTLLRSKALEQRLHAPLGTCPYDMDVLYQFWSHFLIRSFNTRMYDEFRHFAFEDSAHRSSHVGLANLIKFYGESLLSCHSEIRERVARHYVEFVKTENEQQRPALAFKQLRSAWRNDALDPRNRERLDNYMDDDLRAKLDCVKASISQNEAS